MIKLTFLTLAASLMLCSVGAAQQNSRTGEVRLSSSDGRAQRAVLVSGIVSGDRRTLLSEDDDKWTVSNPASLAGDEGRQVTVKCRLSPDQNAIYIFSVKTSNSQYMARRDDAAFRR